MGKYFVTIGLEMHCEGSQTNSKVFSSAKNEYTNIPNQNIRPLDMGFPGTLPVLNKEAVKMSIMMSMILNAKQPEYMYFERKNYYYPDMPKNYQITQNPPEDCVGMGGYLDVSRNDGSVFRVDIDNFHLEEDSASMNHLTTTSTIDYNRAGNPLFELVTKPCIHSADDAVLFLEQVRSIYQYCNISEADSKKGHVRCDVNVSISDNENTLGTKVEVKNVNSFGGVHDCIIYEIERQTKLKNEGRYDEVVQDTRRWDEETGTTIHMRDKIDADDYKYFVEPNIPKFKLKKEWLEEIRKSIPELAPQRKEKYINKYGLTEYDANILVKEKAVSDYYEEVVNYGIDTKIASNWVTTRVLGYVNKECISINDMFITPIMLKELLEMLDKKVISSKQAKDVFYKSLEENKTPKEIIETSGMKQNTNDDEIRTIIIDILNNNEDNIQKYKSGRTNVMDFFVGQVMKQTRGQANPEMTREILKDELEKR